MKEYIKLFDVPQDGHLYKIDNIPFSCYVKNTGQNLECNKLNKKLRNVNEWLVIDDIVYPTENFVDLGLSVRWAKYNAGVDPSDLSTPEKWYGNYYAWGETEPKTYYDWEDPNNILQNYKYANGDYNKLTKYCDNSQCGNDGFTDNLTVLDKTDDLFQVKYYEDWGNKYRMPTKAELEELLDTTKIDRIWIKNYDPTKTTHNPTDDDGIQGLNGNLFTSKIAGYVGCNIFIPAAGSFAGSSWNNFETEYFLWSSSINLGGPDASMCLDGGEAGTSVTDNGRAEGFSVRGVSTK